MSLISGTDTQAWGELQRAAEALRAVSTGELFARDPWRFAQHSLEAGLLFYDYSRQRVDARALQALFAMADELGLRARIAAMFAGGIINVTEQRAVLHTALRRRSRTPLLVEGKDVMPQVLAEREHMLAFAEAVRSGKLRSSTGEAFNLVINIGIGGSDLGPAMAVEALRAHSHGGPRVGFASNVDGCQLADLLAGADPRRTLFIICSKTFSTLETLSNARAARSWLVAALGEAAVPAHFAAVSVNAGAMDAFGVHPDYRFAMWDWVGGRYSIWSSIGVSLAVALGRAGFLEFLEGAADIDEHFQRAPWAANLPVIMGLLGAWNINFQHLPTLAVLPYDQRLSRFPAYLQQLEMESNGKSVRLDGSPVTTETCAVVWGEPGNNAQHSFFQLLHQGTLRAALDLLVSINSSCGQQAHQNLAIANCLAQAEAFAFGQSPAPTPHRAYPGGRAVSVLMFAHLDPRTLGQLIATYEHSVFVQSVVWGNNAFDQWGVELGKKLCEGIVPLVESPLAARTDSASLAGGLAVVHRWRVAAE